MLGGIAMILSDWHIHSSASYDATLSLEEIDEGAKHFGLKKFGITDHANYNDTSFIGDAKRSAESVKVFRKEHPYAVLGIELTPIEKPQFDYIAKHGTREGYVAPTLPNPFDIELAMTKDELMSLGVRYAIGASHWRVDSPNAIKNNTDLQACIKEWYRQQLWLASDERVTILGHPWYHGSGIWYEDFSVIPRSMKMDVAAALKENGKYVECNAHFFNSPKTGEAFRMQYAEYLREMFEMGIPVTYGSDSHKAYATDPGQAEKYLIKCGFTDGDISEIAEKDLW